MPKTLKIITHPNPLLREKSAEVAKGKVNSFQIKEFCLDVAKTMLAKEGIGLAAPQVGKNIRVIAVNTKDGVVSMINPKITRKSLLKEWGEEGCLSVPGVFGQVKRHKKITCEYFDLSAKKIKLKAEGLLARVIQHETDHLDGVLFIDKAKNIKHATHNT